MRHEPLGGHYPAIAAADVFFIHPTTYLSDRASNARYDAADDAALDLAYGDVQRAFDYFIDHESDGWSPPI